MKLNLTFVLDIRCKCKREINEMNHLFCQQIAVSTTPKLRLTRLFLYRHRFVNASPPQAVAVQYVEEAKSQQCHTGTCAFKFRFDTLSFNFLLLRTNDDEGKIVDVNSGFSLIFSVNEQHQKQMKFFLLLFCLVTRYPFQIFSGQ
jgi:hypothetical protein